jgi:hypothetical protein
MARRRVRALKVVMSRGKVCKCLFHPRKERIKNFSAVRKVVER